MELEDRKKKERDFHNKIRKYFFFNKLLNFFEIIDGFVLKIPILKWQAWQSVFILSEPKK